MGGYKSKNTHLVGLWMVSFMIICSSAEAHFIQNVGNQSMGDKSDSESSDDNVSRDSSLSSSSPSSLASSLKDGDPLKVLGHKMSLRGAEENDIKFVNETDDNDDRGASDSSKDGIGNLPNEGRSKPVYGGKYQSGMEWILQRVLGNLGLADDSTGDASNDKIKDSVKRNGTTDILHSGNGTGAPATEGISLNSANVTTFSNVSSQSTNASLSYNVSGLNATNVTNSNSTSPNKSPSRGSSTALTLVKLFLASLYVAGPSAGIFLISPIYAIATRNLMDYFIGSPETVDLLHGAGILGLVVDLTWGAVN